MLEAPNTPKLVVRPKSMGGFSLIEVMIIVAIVAILAAIAAPTFGEYTTNTRVRAAAEALQSDLVRARNEALTRNQPVTLTYNIAAGSSLITTFDLATNSTLTIRSRDLNTERQLESTPANVVVTFNALGQATTGQLALTISKPSPSACETTAGGKVRCMNVIITTTGTSRMCDPKLSYATNTRGC
jgi:type IV fimbrial biogenesis protein FimT